MSTPKPPTPALVDNSRPPARRSWGRGRTALTGLHRTPRPPFDYMQQAHRWHRTPITWAMRFRPVHARAVSAVDRHPQPDLRLIRSPKAPVIFTPRSCSKSRPAMTLWCWAFSVGVGRHPGNAPSGSLPAGVAPSPDQLVHWATPNNPNKYPRPVSGSVPAALGLTFNGATPTPTTRPPFTRDLDHDGFADLRSTRSTSWRTSTRCWVFTSLRNSLWLWAHA